jgi:hypothetical protein
MTAGIANSCSLARSLLEGGCGGALTPSSSRCPFTAHTGRRVGSNPGHATTDTDIRFKSRFETSGEFHRDIPPPTPRSEATVCAVTGGNIAELAATAFVALLIVLLSVRTIGYIGKQCGGGESVSQPALKDKAYLAFLDQNPPFELRRKAGVSRPMLSCNPSWPIRVLTQPFNCRMRWTASAHRWPKRLRSVSDTGRCFNSGGPIIKSVDEEGPVTDVTGPMTQRSRRNGAQSVSGE